MTDPVEEYRAGLERRASAIAEYMEHAVGLIQNGDLDEAAEVIREQALEPGMRLFTDLTRWAHEARDHPMRAVTQF